MTMVNSGLKGLMEQHTLDCNYYKGAIIQSPGGGGGVVVFIA